MDADRRILLLALCFICVSSNEEPDFENSCDAGVCETHTLSPPLGSSVLLPCNLTSGLGWVSWSHVAGLDLVNLTSDGRIKFLDHRYGRVKVFPNQGSVGDYSIRIDELRHSDLGCYRCQQGHRCLQVKLVAVSGAPRRETMPLIYFSAAVAVVTLLSVGVYCCTRCTLCCCKTPIDNTNNPEGVSTEAGARAAPEEPGRVPVEQEQRREGGGRVVYENDDQDPSGPQSDLSRNDCNPIEDLPDAERTQPTPSGMYPNLNQFESVESQKTKQGFHRELFSRLRQASLSRRYYVNRVEMSGQPASSTAPDNQHGAAGFGKKKKAKKNVELQNPIYNRSTDQLNHL